MIKKHKYYNKRNHTIICFFWASMLLVLTCQSFTFGQLVRYKDDVFAGSTTTSNISYGSATTSGGGAMNLQLDFYSPTGDAATSRPLVIFLHGGGMTGGDKVSGYGSLVASALTKKGYAVASINYRVGVPTDTDTSYFQALYRGIQDGKAAVRFFRRYASTYKIDTTQIFLTGSSAGSKIALHMAYMDQSDVPAAYAASTIIQGLGTLEGNSGNPGYSSKVQGVISCWGALWKYEWIQAGDVPLYCVHGMTDTTVPYDSSFSYHNLGIFKYGSQILYNWTTTLGIKNGITLFPSTGHTLDNNTTKQSQGIADFSAWLYTVLSFSTRSTYYVDAVSGNDANNGTSSSTPWKTLTKVNSTTFAAEDSILFKCGQTWTGQLYPKGTGSSGKPITIGKYGTGTAPVINGNGAVTDAVYLQNQEYWTIRDLEITNPVVTPDAVLRRGVTVIGQDFGTIHNIKLINLYIHDVNGDVTNKEVAGIFANITGTTTQTNFDSLLIDSCRIVNIDRTGIATDSYWATRTLETNTNWFPSTHVIIRNSWIEKSGGNGLILRVASSPLIERNTFKQCGYTQTGNALFPFNCDDALIQYNEIYQTVYNAGDVDASAIDSDYRCKRTVIQYNYSHDNDGGFLVVTCQGGVDRFNDGTIVRYNISQNDHGEIIYLSGQTTNTKIYNNVVYSGAGNSYSYLVHLNSWLAWPDSTTYQNNIFSIADGAGTYDFGSSTNNLFSYNLFYGVHSASEPSDAHKLTGNPLFVSAGSGSTGINSVTGYKISSGSPAKNSGSLMSGQPSLDFWSNPVPDGVVDRGVNEFISTNKYSLSISATNGSVAKNLDKVSYDSAEVVILTPTASTHYHFANWTGDVPAGGHTTDNPLSLTMNSNKSLTAVFALDTFTVTTSALNGTVNASPSAAYYAYGTSVTLTPTPSSGYSFNGWSGDVAPASINNNPLVLSVTANLNVTASFVASQNALTTVFSDNFNRTDATPVTPTLTYTTTNTGNATSSITSNVLKFSTSAGTAGRSYITGAISSVASPYTAVLSANSDIVTWTFNVQTNRTTQPLSGFDATKFGIAAVLGATNRDLLATGCNGYAIVNGGFATRDYRLVRFTNGLGANANLTSIIAGLVLTSGNEYVSVKVTYTPSTNTWKLYERNDGAAAFGDPLTLAAANLIGVGTVDGTYTASTMSGFGFLWNYSTSTTASNNVTVDNYIVSVGSNPVLYYYNGSGVLNTLGSWGTSINGTGTNPTSFTDNKQVFNLQNTTAATLSTNLTISGTNSKMIIGDGSNNTSLTINDNIVLSGTVEVSNKGTLNLTTQSLPVINSNAGTVNFNSTKGYTLTSNYSLPSSSGVYNLTASDIAVGAYALSVFGKLNLNTYKVSGVGSFVLENSATLTTSNVAGITASSALGAVQTTTRTLSTLANYGYTGSGSCYSGDGLPATVNNLSINLGDKSSTLTLSNSVTSSGSVDLTRGKVKLGSNNLTFNATANQSDSSYFVTDGTGSAIRYISTTDLVSFPIGSTSQFRNADINFLISPIPSYISAMYINSDPGMVGVYPNGINKHFKEYWSFSSDGEPLEPFTLKLNCTNIVGLNNPATVKFMQRANNSSPWAVAGTLNYAGSGSILSSTNVVGFNEVTLGSGPDNALPVELRNFAVRSNGKSVTLNWSTATEVNSAFFEIYKSNRVGVSTIQGWAKIGVVKANGNSNSLKNYSFNENSNPGNYLYRLKIIDSDGSFKYSSTIEVNVALPKDFCLEQNYPNPFNPSTEIKYSIPEDAKVNISLYSITGQLVNVVVDEQQSAGYHSVRFDASRISSGVYFYQMTAGGFRQIKKLTILK